MRVTNYRVLHFLFLFLSIPAVGWVCYYAYGRDFLSETLVICGSVLCFVSWLFAIVLSDRISVRRMWCKSVGESIMRAKAIVSMDNVDSDCVVSMGRRGLVIDDFDDILVILYDDMKTIVRDHGVIYLSFEDYSCSFEFDTEVDAKSVTNILFTKCKNATKKRTMHVDPL